MKDYPPFATPRHICDIADCYFYHTRSKGLKRLIKRLLGLPISAHPGTLYFLPNYRSDDPNMAVTWWSFPPAVICEMLGTLGFERTAVTEHFQLFQDKKMRMYTVVGWRTQPMPNPA